MEENKEKQPQDLFCDFVERCIIGKIALITEYNGDLFTEDNLNKTKKFLVAIINSNNPIKNKTSNSEETEDKYGVSNIFNVKDPLWKKEEYKNIQEIIIKILLHCYWLMYLGSDRLKMQDVPADYYVQNASSDFFENINCVWAIGQTFTRDPLGAMLKIVEMIIFLEKLNKDEGININSTIIEYWSQKEKDYEKNSNVANIILYFCDTTHFLPIPSYDNKKKIRKNLECLASSSPIDNEVWAKKMSKLDKKLYLIRGYLKNLKKLKLSEYSYSAAVKLKPDNPFWHPKIRPFWEDTKSNIKGDLSLEELLEYKKALVLYGPPGTSKSYRAQELAEHIIARSIKKKGALTAADFEGFSSKCESHIHSLQFHPNYTYDDFIIGKTIKGKNVEVEEGWLLKLIDEINKDTNDTLPHVVILDEINRVDISRVFGELLTAMEPAYRKKKDSAGNAENKKEGVELPVKDKKGNKIKLIVPENMYFIGTMNQIDFSLEQVDFALRRRFIWQLSTYNKDALKEIIDYKIKEAQTLDIQDEWVSAYCSQCTSLNNIIRDNENLGESFWIGHTYFAEIIDIYIQINAKADKKWDAAKNVLWQISIKPTLEAYCGTMDTTKQQEFINKCLGAFKLTESATEPDSNDEESE